MPSERRVALVTGGAKRVGRAIVERLAQGGFDVAFTYHTSSPDPLMQHLRALGRRAIAIKADLTHPEEAVARIAAEFGAAFGRLDVLVNNASAFESGRLTGDLQIPNAQNQSDAQEKPITPVSERSEDPDPSGNSLGFLKSMRTLNAIHVESPLLLCQKFESMLRVSRGHVINMIDLLAERPTRRFLIYSASKAALANLTLSLAAAMAPEVTVNGISPGVVEWSAGYSDTQKQKYLQRVPLSRAGTPEDVAELVHFLVTAAPYVTGQIIRLDGGRSIT